MENDPIGFFVTWTCYGTWLPGDRRGWIKWHRGYQTPEPLLEDWCRDQLCEDAVSCPDQRGLVRKTVADHCRVRGWVLHEDDCRTNHVHVVVTAPEYRGTKVRDEFKAWCTRRLKQQQRSMRQSVRSHWWAEGGSVRLLFDEDSLQAAIVYVRDSQEKGGSKANE